MLQRWDSADLLLGMGAITHPGHKILSWLTALITISFITCDEQMAQKARRQKVNHKSENSVKRYKRVVARYVLKSKA